MNELLNRVVDLDRLAVELTDKYIGHKLS